MILCNPQIDNSVRIDLAEGVGFPLDHVFKFDSALSESLLHAWGEGDLPKLELLWENAAPYAE